MDIYNPDYYRTGKIEVADFIEDKGFNFFLGNVVKYVSRAGMKKDNSAVQDLKKAQWYLDREIKCLEGNDTVCLNGGISYVENGCHSCKSKCDSPTSGSNIKKPKKKIELEFGSKVKGNTVEYMSDDEYADTVSTITNIIFGDDDDDYPYTDEDFEWDDSDGEEIWSTIMTAYPPQTKRPKKRRRNKKDED